MKMPERKSSFTVILVETLDSLCNYFDCEIEDIIKHIKD